MLEAIVCRLMSDSQESLRQVVNFNSGEHLSQKTGAFGAWKMKLKSEKEVEQFEQADIYIKKRTIKRVML